MANTYEDKTGKVFNTKEEAKASNLALGTNPMPANINTGATPLAQNQTFMDWMKTPGNLTIPTSSLTEQVTPYNIPPVNTNVDTSVLSSLNQSNIPTTTTTDTGKSDLAQTFKDYLTTDETARNQILADQTSPEFLAKEERTRKLGNELTALDKEYQDQVENIRKTTSGMTRDQQQGALSEAQYNYENRRANKSLAYNVAFAVTALAP